MRRAVVVALVSVGVFGLASSAPVTPSEPLSGTHQVCFPADQFQLDYFEVIPVNVPAGASLTVRVSWVFVNGSDAGEDFRTVTDLVPGQSVALDPATPDAGRCARFSASAGLTYQLVVHRETDPTNYLAWVNDLFTPGTIWGFPPI